MFLLQQQERGVPTDDKLQMMVQQVLQLRLGLVSGLLF